MAFFDLCCGYYILLVVVLFGLVLVGLVVLCLLVYCDWIVWFGLSGLGWVLILFDVCFTVALLGCWFVRVMSLCAPVITSCCVCLVVVGRMWWVECLIDGWLCICWWGCGYF